MQIIPSSGPLPIGTTIITSSGVSEDAALLSAIDDAGDREQLDFAADGSISHVLAAPIEMGGYALALFAATTANCDYSVTVTLPAGYTTTSQTTMTLCGDMCGGIPG